MKKNPLKKRGGISQSQTDETICDELLNKMIILYFFAGGKIRKEIEMYHVLFWDSFDKFVSDRDGREKISQLSSWNHERSWRESKRRRPNWSLDKCLSLILNLQEEPSEWLGVNILDQAHTKELLQEEDFEDKLIDALFNLMGSNTISMQGRKVKRSGFGKLRLRTLDNIREKYDIDLEDLILKSYVDDKKKKLEALKK